MNIDVEISRSFGHQKTAWQKIKSASQKTIELKTHLDLNNLHGLSDAMLGHVSTMTHMKSIILDSSSGFSAEGIKHLYRLPRLELLSLRSTGVSNCALEGIGSLTSLEKLYLWKTNVTDAGLPHLTALPSLKLLWLSECKGVTDDGMVHVGRLTGLENLGLDSTAVTDDGLQQLTALTKLTTLWPPEGMWIKDNGREVRRRLDRKGGKE
ncbi:unnamed protein product [Closterium sp. Yama58-4]|nr:unnamed protein product [Closterium sp. Yama58-4]